MCQAREFTFESAGGLSAIRAMEWSPAEGQARGIVQIAHGICEHIGRYDDFARYLVRHGFIVVAADHLGHGKSYQKDQNRGFFGESGGWFHVVEDMHRLYQQTHDRYPRIPYFLLGHSMGSFLTRTYIIRHQGHLKGVLLSGTGQQPAAAVNFGISYADRLIKRHGPRYRSKRLSVLCFGTYNNAFMPVRTLSDWLTRDETLLDEHLADEMCNFIPTVSMFRDMFLGIRFMSNRRNLEKMQRDLPVYFFSGDKDPVGEAGAGVRRSVQSFLDAGCRDVSLKLYAEGRHEILNELNRDQVYEDTLRWLESKL